MWGEIMLIVVLESVFTIGLQYDADGVDFDVVQDPNSLEEAQPRKNLTVNIHPADMEVIKGVIKKLLGQDEIQHIKYHASTEPTHSQPPDGSTQTPTRTTSILSSITEGFRLDYEGLVPTDKPERTPEEISGNKLGDGADRISAAVSTARDGSSDRLETGTVIPDRSTVSEVTRSAPAKLDWFQRQELELPMMFSEGLPEPLTPDAVWTILGTSALRTDEPRKAQSTTPVKKASYARKTSAVPSNVTSDSSDIAVRMGFGNRTRFTRRTYGSTRNTLCTESDEVCRTMCFDREKYRISCPTTTPRPTTPYLDITKLLDMLQFHIEDYDTNLTAVMNKTLHEKGYKHCLPTTTFTTTTTLEPPRTPPMYDYEPSEMTGNVVSKCYVCGMEELGIPINAHCSDPFAKELLPPAMPDHVASLRRKGFKKYCKYMDMKQWYVNGSGMWGRWSGGCAVRWVDLSGVYTQRVCRDRDRPALGRHFISKRLAKLEFALRKVDNGCMLSPMATLVPFSRGVSLYARLHVCVCSTNWCNAAKRLATSLWVWAVAPLTALRS